MLAPDSRAVAVDLLRPPAEHRLDFVVLTTYSLDLETLLALPLAVLAHEDGAVESLLEDPMKILVALREAGERIIVFADAGAIAPPRNARTLFSTLESSVVPVRAPGKGAFHPKVWIARFLGPGDQPLLRVAVLSRNLTDDRSWDVALTSEGVPRKSPRVDESRALGDLVRALPKLSSESLADGVSERLAALAAEVERTHFPAPEGFEDGVTYTALGLQGRVASPWRPRDSGSRLLAVAPFVNQTALNTLAKISNGHRTLVSRQDTLDALSDDVIAQWMDVFVLQDPLEGESEDGEPQAGAVVRPSGLHAKLVVVEHGWDASWWMGSANITEAAYLGKNVEVVAAVTGKKGTAGGKTGQGIDRFFEAGFRSICAPYQRKPLPAVEPGVVEARQRLEEARRAIGGAQLRAVCTPSGDQWRWTVQGELPDWGDLQVDAWPVSLAERMAQNLTTSAGWTVSMAELTVFLSVRLRAPGAGVDDVRLVLKLPADGMPEGRSAHVLRSLIDSPERLLRLLRALLGGVESLLDWGKGAGEGADRSGGWASSTGGEGLLEELVRAAAAEPKRLDAVRSLINDLRETEEGRKLVPADVYALWQVVDAAVGPPSKEQQ